MFTMDVQDKLACRELVDKKGKEVISPLSLLIRNGNTKLPRTTAIFNMGSAHSCPSMTLGICSASLCGVKCYAKKAEYSYHPNVRPFRDRQEKFWKGISGKDFVTQFLFMNALKRNPYSALRLNESGDFWSQACVDKAEYIASELKKYGVTVYCYTSRSDLSYEHCEHLIVNASNFEKNGITNIFKIIKKNETIPQGYGLCGGDCRICSKCQIKDQKTCVVAH